MTFMSLTNRQESTPSELYRNTIHVVSKTNYIETRRENTMIKLYVAAFYNIVALLTFLYSVNE
jgi:hypothetical protein